MRQRLKWIQLYEQVGNAGIVCLKCGISRPTLRKWLHRYQEMGLQGLVSQSRKPHHSPTAKIGKDEEKIILELRKGRNLGARRIQNELKRHHDLSLSLATIHKVLTRVKAPSIIKNRKKANYIRYERPIPGDRVQMDTCKIGPRLYQFTAVDDCTRYKVVRLYRSRAASNTLDFIDHVVEDMPFPIQRIQTDRGQEFFATKVQEKLREYGIKFRPIKPGSPHLNGKVERAQKTDLVEFYALIDLKDPAIHELLDLWQHYYNWNRPHGALRGKTPMERYFELSDQTPFTDEVLKDFCYESERIQNQNYKTEMELRKLKRCL